MTTIYQTSAHNKSPMEVATEFCNTYWDAPRKFKVNKNASTDSKMIFRLSDGMRDYSIILVPGLLLQSEPVYQVQINNC